jgi:flagellar FliJ protein
VPRFIFKLEGVFRQRKQVERQRQRDVAIVQAQARQTEQELRALNDAMKTSTEQVRTTQLIGKLDMTFLAAHRRYLAAMQRKGQLLVQKLAAQQRQVEAARLVLAEAAKARKAIEKLKERRWEQWMTDQAKREIAELDEVSQQMAFGDLRSEI